MSNDVRIYKFYDTDRTGQQEYDIEGIEYKRLLELCFKYCTTFSFIVQREKINTMLFLDCLDAYRLEVTENVERVYEHYNARFPAAQNERMDYEIRHYVITPESREILEGITDSVFKWIYGWGYHNPNDLAFFRADESVFFSSVIHEGECTLTPNNNENVDIIINNSNWVLQT